MSEYYGHPLDPRTPGAPLCRGCGEHSDDEESDYCYKCQETEPATCPQCGAEWDHMANRCVAQCDRSEKI
jgi:predicted amidophosphoribosyltransferase